MAEKWGFRLELERLLAEKRELLGKVIIKGTVLAQIRTLEELQKRLEGLTYDTDPPDLREDEVTTFVGWKCPKCGGPLTGGECESCVLPRQQS